MINRTLHLERLATDIPALPPSAGHIMAEACMVCFEKLGHRSGVELKIYGTFIGSFSVVWEGTVTDRMRRYWQDEEEATEYAAYSLALLLIKELTGYTAIERAHKGTGVDFWLGPADIETYALGTYSARLEVSGIRQGNKRHITERVRQKRRQTDASNGEHPAYIAVIELSTPLAHVVVK